ncbi:MAG: aspartate aminotransferase family protein [Pseudonocardiaceae bacterium]|nr:aspartate aminotransferase family protein [Pseudonocardiaceae bacterium]
MTAATSLAGGTTGAAHLRPLIDEVLDALARGAIDRDGPLPGASHEGVAAAVRAACGQQFLPDDGVGAPTALRELTRAFAAGAADPADPACAAHLHCPPLAVAVAADLVAATLNPSMDSWDQAPAGTALEPEVIAALSDLVGYPGRADGVITSGGTESNLMGLLLARDHAVRTKRGLDPARTGLLPDDAGRLRVLCSSAAHFSVARGAGLLGLGEDSVVAVPAGPDHRMDVAALHRELAAQRAAGGLPVAIVATAGTTDAGAIDPLPEIADAAAEHGAWLHVDAAYGGGALFSQRLAPLLTGIARADSVALDLHKLGWQPVPAGVFLARAAELFAPLERSVAYLNADDDQQAGYPSLLNRSLRTTRRPDVFKIAVTLRALGRSGLGALVDRCHELAHHAAARVAATPRLELFTDPVLSTVVFRYVPASQRYDPDAINAELRRVLLAEGRAVIGRTEAAGAIRLKLTLLNPHATEADIDALLDGVVSAGDKEVR